MKLRNKKTGDIGDFLLVMQDDDIKLWSITNCYETYHYKSLLDFNNDWEGCEPAEPLIKDEKIRKAVRAWAEASDIEAVYLSSEALCWIEGFAKIEFAGNRDWFKELEEGKRYTITELCGEEEE